MAFTGFSLPPELQKSAPLVPALQSNWLVMHVTVMIASYAALLLGCLVAIAYLVFFHFFSSEKKPSLPNFSLEISGDRTKNQRLNSEVNSGNSLIQGSPNMELALLETVDPKNSIISSSKTQVLELNEVGPFSKTESFGTNFVFGKGKGKGKDHLFFKFLPKKLEKILLILQLEFQSCKTCLYY